ncbi:MAG: hypothetical protein AB7P76_12050 [Candidatus Melainabacteria bacterium]
MARIMENNQGRRMIRLSAEDVLMVVSLYQQQLYSLQQQTYDEKYDKLKALELYLPEDP